MGGEKREITGRKEGVDRVKVQRGMGCWERDRDGKGRCKGERRRKKGREEEEQVMVVVMMVLGRKVVRRLACEKVVVQH